MRASGGDKWVWRQRGRYSAIRLRRAGRGIGRVRHGRGHHRGQRRIEGPDHRKGAALWRFHGPLRRWLWIPGTALALQGIHETPDEARAYLRHEAGDSYNGERVDAFLAHGPEAVDFFTANTEVQFDMPLVFPDYHAEAAGGKQGGRSMVARPYDGRKLGAHVACPS